MKTFLNQDQGLFFKAYPEKTNEDRLTESFEKYFKGLSVLKDSKEPKATLESSVRLGWSLIVKLLEQNNAKEVLKKKFQTECNTHIQYLAKFYPSILSQLPTYLQPYRFRFYQAAEGVCSRVSKSEITLGCLFVMASVYSGVESNEAANNMFISWLWSRAIGASIDSRSSLRLS